MTAGGVIPRSEATRDLLFLTLHNLQGRIIE